MEHENLSGSDQQFLAVLDKFKPRFEKTYSLVSGDLISDFSFCVDQVEEHLQDIKTEGRELRLGIIGTVKAGKSSLLNALVFDGAQVLPKAPTPMTAALTKLQFAETPKAVIHFYKEYDWRNIAQKSAEYDREAERAYQEALEKLRQQQMNGSSIYTAPPEKSEVEKRLRLPESLVSCHELVTMAEERGLNPDEFLGKEKEISGDSGQTAAEYIKTLKEYVGADGKYTPLVNYIDLSINMPLLKGLEIVDTPGLNDPIASRSDASKKYITACDAVLIVCSVSQFLTSGDVALISKQLESQGVFRAYIIGSMLDSGILQYNKSKRFQEAFSGSINEYTAQADRELNKLPGGPDSLAGRLKRSLPPVFTSSVFFSIAKKRSAGQPLSKEEDFILQNMRKRFPDFDEVMSSTEDYCALAGIGEVKDRVYGEVLREKEEIIAKRIKEYTNSQTVRLLALLEKLDIAARTGEKSLQAGDVHQLEQKLALLDEKLNSIRMVIFNLFSAKAVESRRHIQDVKLDLYGSDGQDAPIATKSTTEYRYIENRYGFLGLMRETVTETLEVPVASAADAVANISAFGASAQRTINSHLHRLIDIEGLKKSVETCVIGAFDLADKQFDPNEILVPLETALDKLRIWEVTCDYLDRAQEAIYTAFPSGEVRGQQIYLLKQLQQEQIQNMLRDFSEELDKLADKVSEEMQAQAGSFVDDIRAKIAGNIEITKQLLSNKKENLEQYQAFISDITACKAQLRQLQR